jgi:hypothetical protein
MKHRLNTDKKDFVFTLVELLVIIAIIGIPAALVLAGIAGAKGRAQRIQCANNLHQLGVGLQVILADNHVILCGWIANAEVGLARLNAKDWAFPNQKQIIMLRVFGFARLPGSEITLRFQTKCLSMATTFMAF